MSSIFDYMSPTDIITWMSRTPPCLTLLLTNRFTLQNTCLNTTLESEDAEIFDLIAKEKWRQYSCLELIASEVSSSDVDKQEIQGHWFYLCYVLELHFSSCYGGQRLSFDQQILWR
jgi:hypothetical protein